LLDLTDVLLNLYRNDRDNVSCYSDDKPKMGLGPVIAGISRQRNAPLSRLVSHRTETSLPSLESDGGLLLDHADACGSNWLRSVARRTHAGPRDLNLTFRRVPAV